MALLVEPGLFALVVGLFFALMVGSFLNVVILRLPVMMEREWLADTGQATEEQQERFNLAVPASRCNSCGHQIRWFENIPVISFLVLKGRCSQCGTRISARYPSIEVLSGLPP